MQHDEMRQNNFYRVFSEKSSSPFCLGTTNYKRSIDYKRPILTLFIIILLAIVLGTSSLAWKIMKRKERRQQKQGFSDDLGKDHLFADEVISKN